MKPDTTILLRLVRASAQGIADECTSILATPPTMAEQAAEAAFAATVPAAVAEPATPTPAKRGRKPAAPAPVAEPVVVTTPEPPTNVEVTPPPPQPAVDLGKSSVTDTELASAAGEVKADPAKLARYFEWRNQSTFHGGRLVSGESPNKVWEADGTTISGEGKSLAQIPNVGDNWDRLLEALKRAAL